MGLQKLKRRPRSTVIGTRVVPMAYRWREASLLLALVLIGVIPSAHGQLANHPGCGFDNGACIVPVDGSQFVLGALFDLRIEVHRDSMPGDFFAEISSPSLKIDSKALDVFFKKKPVEEGPYNFQKYSDLRSLRARKPTNVTVFSFTWRNVSLTQPGEYLVRVLLDGSLASVTYFVKPQTRRLAKNVILFIGDGMSQGIITAGRVISRGQTNGKYNRLWNMETLGSLGLISTSGINAIVTDSANSATAYNTGHKAATSVLGVSIDTTEDQFDDPKMETIAEIVKRTRGMAVGVVTTAEVQDATPGAVWAHTANRKNKAEILDQAIHGVANFSAFKGVGIRPDVLLGGGGAYFHAPSSLGEKDYYKLFHKVGYTVVTNKTDLLASVSGAKLPDHLVGIFHDSNLDTWLDRNVYTNNIEDGSSPLGDGGAATDQPGLVDMTLTALKVLEPKPNGFFLMVEGAQIDKMAHAMDWDRMFGELIEFDNAVGAAQEWARARPAADTLIIVTADHGSGVDVFGTVDTSYWNQLGGKPPGASQVIVNSTKSKDVVKRKAVGVYAQSSPPGYQDANLDGFPDDWSPRVVMAVGTVGHPEHRENWQIHKKGKRAATASHTGGYYVANPGDCTNGVYQGGTVPPDVNAATHSMIDVPVFATGPNAQALARVQENTHVFFVIADALGLGNAAGPRRVAGMQEATVAASAGFVLSAILLLLGC